jgi:hypothetical protein
VSRVCALLQMEAQLNVWFDSLSVSGFEWRVRTDKMRRSTRTPLPPPRSVHASAVLEMHTKRPTMLLLHLCAGVLSSAQSACAPMASLSIDVTKLRLAAHSLLVNGSGLMAAYVPTVDTIDRQLTVAFDLPEITLSADAPSAFNQTCGRSWRCGCLRYEVCPGMQLTAAMMRDFGTVHDTHNVPPTRTVRRLVRWASKCATVAWHSLFGCTPDALVRVGGDCGQGVLTASRRPR